MRGSAAIIWRRCQVKHQARLVAEDAISIEIVQIEARIATKVRLLEVQTQLDLLLHGCLLAIIVLYRHVFLAD